METIPGKQNFAGAVPEIYQRYLVPMIFAGYADDLAARVRALGPLRVLEIAAGTGAATRALAAALPPSAAIVATDLAPAMLAQAQALGTARPVDWRQADGQRLPFPDGSFDAVACQFGAMFFPDKPKAYAEARRVLGPGGAYVFNVWGELARNPFTAEVTEAVAALFPSDPPRFLARLPHGYADPAAIRRDLVAGGFAEGSIAIERIALRSRASSPGEVAQALCQGTPLRGEIEARDPARLGEATAAAARRIAERFGEGPVEAGIEAFVITARLT